MLQAAAEDGVDGIADALFVGANDLVVNTAHAWRIGPAVDGAEPPPPCVRNACCVCRPPAAGARSG